MGISPKIPIDSNGSIDSNVDIDSNDSYDRSIDTIEMNKTSNIIDRVLKGKVKIDDKKFIQVERCQSVRPEHSVGEIKFAQQRHLQTVFKTTVDNNLHRSPNKVYKVSKVNKLGDKSANSDRKKSVKISANILNHKRKFSPNKKDNKKESKKIVDKIDKNIVKDRISQFEALKSQSPIKMGIKKKERIKYYFIRG